MTTIPAKAARDSFAETVNRVAYGKERVVLTRHGSEIAAIVPIEDARLLEELEDRLDLDEARASLADAKRNGTIPWDKVKSDLGL